MTDVTIAFIDPERGADGVEPIGTLLPIASSTYAFATSVRVQRSSTRRGPDLPGDVRPAGHEERYHEQAQAA